LADGVAVSDTPTVLVDIASHISSAPFAEYRM
jgi:hypothetical protein